MRSGNRHNFGDSLGEQGRDRKRRCSSIAMACSASFVAALSKRRPIALVTAARKRTSAWQRQPQIGGGYAEAAQAMPAAFMGLQL